MTNLRRAARVAGEGLADPVATRATVRMRLVDGDRLVDDLRPA